MRELIEKMADRNIGSLCLFLNNKKNIDYLEFLNKHIPSSIIDRSNSEKIYYFVNKNDILLCGCGKHLSFIGFKNGYRPTCGDKVCYSKKRKETCLERYGVDNPKKSKEILKKERENILNKWGGEHYMLNKDVKQKFNSTMMENHGVEWAQQSKKISDKSKVTFSDNPNKSDIIKNRAEKISNKSNREKKEISDKKKTTIIDNWGSVDNLYKHISDKVREKSIENFGVEHHFSHPDIIKKRVNSYYETITNNIKNKLPSDIIYIERVTNSNNTDNIIKLKCLKCDEEFDINRQYLVNRQKVESNICLHCNPRLSGISNMELDLLNYINDNYKGEIITSDRTILNGRELDIYLPELNLAFEFNGLYWHSELYKDRLYHINKTKECLDKGVQLIHIWEDDWVYKNEVVKSIILNKLGFSEKIYARKCVIKEVNNTDVRNFLNLNHIQGFVGSKVKIGLYYNDELVSLMTFGYLRKSLGQKSEDDVYELLRFCNKSGSSVIGGASKLFKHFLKKSVKGVISYSDSSRGVGNLYKQLGFEFIHESVPNYYYVIDGVRKHRFNFRKDKLVKEGGDSSKTEIQIMNDRGIYRIFDCGSKKWIFKI